MPRWRVDIPDRVSEAIIEAPGGPTEQQRRHLTLGKCPLDLISSAIPRTGKRPPERRLCVVSRHAWDNVDILDSAAHSEFLLHRGLKRHADAGVVREICRCVRDTVRGQRSRLVSAQKICARAREFQIAFHCRWRNRTCPVCVCSPMKRGSLAVAGAARRGNDGSPANAQLEMTGTPFITTS
jgi:hypothetical protein